MTDLSIITITYNDPGALEKTLNSLKPLIVMNVNWEHVIVDSSPEISAPAYKAIEGLNWPRIEINPTPRGIYPAQNAGLEKAQGNVLWFLNGGDKLTDAAALKRTLQEFKDQDGEILCAGVNLWRNSEFLYSIIPSAPFISNILGSNHLCHQGVLYRREVFKKIGSYSEKYKLAADYEHHFKCHIQNLKVAFSPEKICDFDMAGQSQNYRAVFKEFRDIQKSLELSLPRKVNMLNRWKWTTEFARVALMKAVGNSVLGKWAKPIWYQLKGE